MSGLTALLTTSRLIQLLAGQYAAAVHTHGQAEIDNLVATLAGKLNTSGGILSGALLTPDGSASACAIAVGAANTGLFRDGNGLQLAHSGTHAFEVRNSGVFFRVNAQPATDNVRTMGAFNLRFSRVHATHYRATLGSGVSLGYLFDDGAGNVVNSGMYAVSNTTLGFNLNGSSVATFTSAGLTLQTGVFRPPTYTVGTMPSASANAGGMILVNNIQARSDGTNWRYLTDNSIVT